MRYTALSLVLAAACGNGNHDPKDGPGSGSDMAQPLIDAPPLLACTPRSGTNVSLRPIGMTGASALLATSPPNDGRLFVVEQDGRILIFENETLKPTPFLDLDQIGGTGFVADAPQGERGLLGLAFSPNYAFNRELYVFYTTNNANVVARYHQSATDPNVADTAGEVILSIPDFAANHNGGMMQFGKDGYLYIGTGDGGGAGDPHRNGQAIDRTATTCTSSQCEPLLGKILRIDVNNTTGLKKYGIPSDNPFATAGGEPEIFVIGVRNPWRWSLDRETGDMWIGDVGQGAIEELDVLKAGAQAGKNLGWSKYEGTQCYGNYTPCVSGENNANGFSGPLFTRTHTGDGWLAIIGGDVYRGDCFPDLKGSYFTTDNTAHGLVRATYDGNSVNATDLTPPTGGWPTGPASIHADARGELFMTTTSGRIYQIEAGP